jgi:hypothetical protein
LLCNCKFFLLTRPTEIQSNRLINGNHFERHRGKDKQKSVHQVPMF